MAGKFLDKFRMHSAEDIALTTNERRHSKGSLRIPLLRGGVQPSLQELTTTSCLVCIAPYRQPKVLSCNHMFCETCLSEYGRLFTNDGGVPCPICQQMTHGYVRDLPAGSVTTSTRREVKRKSSVFSSGALQQCDTCAFGTGSTKAEFHCVACAMNFCAPCRHTHDQQPLFQAHSVMHLFDREVLRVHCQRHNRMASIYFCLDCAVTACTVCVLKDHENHATARICEMLSTHRDNISTLLQSISPILCHLEQWVHKLVPNHTGLRRFTMSSAPDMLTGKQPHSNKQDRCCHHVTLLQALFQGATHLLQMSQSELLLALYEQLEARLRTALNFELPILCQLFDSSSHLQLDARTTKPPLCKMQSLLYRPRVVWKMEKYDLDELWNPCAATFLSNGTLAVASYDTSNEQNNGLHLFDPFGAPLTSIAQGHLKPLGVTTTREGLLATTDCLSKRVRLYTASGQPAGEFGKGQFGWPYGITVNSRGQFIVSDAFNDTVSIYQPDGKRVQQFGSAGNGPTHFRNPYHIAVDSLDNILVADSGNNAVKIFDSQANYMFAISKIHKGLSSELSKECLQYKRLKGPRGVSIDAKGNIMVADEHSRIALFDATGTYLRNILTDEDAVKNPEAIATSKNGLMAVTEWNPNNMCAVKVFSIYE